MPVTDQTKDRPRPSAGEPERVERRERRGLATFVVWSFLSTIFLVWVVALLLATGILSQVAGLPDLSSTERALAVFAIGLTICCGILWVGHVTSAVILREHTGKRIWITLVAVVLSASGAAISGIFQPEAHGVGIRDIMVLDETRLPDPHVRPDTIFQGETSPVVLLYSASGFALTADGAIDATVIVALVNPSTGLAEYQEVHRKVLPGQWLKSEFGSKARQLLTVENQSFASAVVLSDRMPIGTGKLQLKLTIRDMVSGKSDSRTLELDFRA